MAMAILKKYIFVLIVTTITVISQGAESLSTSPRKTLNKQIYIIHLKTLNLSLMQNKNVGGQLWGKNDDPDPYLVFIANSKKIFENSSAASDSFTVTYDDKNWFIWEWTPDSTLRIKCIDSDLMLNDVIFDIPFENKKPLPNFLSIYIDTKNSYLLKETKNCHKLKLSCTPIKNFIQTISLSQFETMVKQNTEKKNCSFTCDMVLLELMLKEKSSNSKITDDYIKNLVIKLKPLLADNDDICSVLSGHGFKAPEYVKGYKIKDIQENNNTKTQATEERSSGVATPEDK